MALDCRNLRRFHLRNTVHLPRPTIDKQRPSSDGRQTTLLALEIVVSKYSNYQLLGQHRISISGICISIKWVDLNEKNTTKLTLNWTPQLLSNGTWYRSICLCANRLPCFSLNCFQFICRTASLSAPRTHTALPTPTQTNHFNCIETYAFTHKNSSLSSFHRSISAPYI